MGKQTFELSVSWQIGDNRSGDGWGKKIEIPRKCSWLQARKIMEEEYKKDNNGRSYSFLTNVKFTENNWRQLLTTGKFSYKRDEYNYLKLTLHGDVVFRPLTLKERVERIERHLQIEN